MAPGLLETSLLLTSAKISDVALMWLGYCSDVARIWLGCGSVVARIWLGCAFGCGSDLFLDVAESLAEVKGKRFRAIWPDSTSIPIELPRPPLLQYGYWSW